MIAAARRPPTTRASLAGWLVVVASGLVSCAGPPPPDWRINAHGALERALDAHLSGDSRVAAVELDRARTEIARSGRVDLMARAELAHCAAELASLQYQPCVAFEALRPDAASAEQAYADFLLGRLDAGRIERLPAQQRAVAAASAGAASDLALMQGMADPLSRLVAAATWLRTGRATPDIIELAVDTASAQGWRRPLLAWLGVQEQRAGLAGDRPAQERIGRRIRLILDGSRKPA